MKTLECCGNNVDEKLGIQQEHRGGERDQDDVDLGILWEHRVQVTIDLMLGQNSVLHLDPNGRIKMSHIWPIIFDTPLLLPLSHQIKLRSAEARAADQ